MKILLVLFALTLVTGSLAQNRGTVNKGGNCIRDDDCILDYRNMRCIRNYCGCRIGERQEQETHPGSSSQVVCSGVVGLGCSNHDECSVDMPNAKCNLNSKRCECNKLEGCTDLKNKGEECAKHEECINDIRNMKCVNSHCGCKKGQRQLEESNSDGTSQFKCQNVVGLGCTRDDECSADLDNAKCNQSSYTCECKKVDGCNGASSMAIISFLPMVLLSLGLLKSW